MKILQLTKKFPFPLMDGESIAVHYLSKAMNDLGCEITLCSMNTSKHYSDLEKLPNGYHHYTHIETVDVDNRVKVLGAFLNLFSRKSYHVTRFESKKYAKKLAALLAENSFDFILLETLYLTPYIPFIRKRTQTPIIMRSHNLEYEIWERMLKNMRFSLIKLYLMFLVRKLKRYELARLNDYDFLLTVTQRDLSNFVKLGYKKSGMVVPIGIDCRDYQGFSPYVGNTLRLSFIGSLDWMPNMEGISWFLENVWNVHSTKLAGIELHIAGRNTPESFLKNKSENIIIHGEVPDARDFIVSCQVMIVPLFSGSGMRVKILEAMALGRVVITTSLGLEGIVAKDGQHVLIANTAINFLEKINYCRKNPRQVQKIGESAAKLIETQYDNIRNAKNLIKTLQNIKNQIDYN